MSTVQTQTVLEKYKLSMQLEGLDELNRHILEIGQTTLRQYKIKSSLMSQYSIDSSMSNYKFMKSQCKRMIQFLHFHLSSHIFELKADQELIFDNASPLGKYCKKENFLVNSNLLKEAQKYRD